MTNEAFTEALAYVSHFYNDPEIVEPDVSAAWRSKDFTLWLCLLRSDGEVSMLVSRTPWILKPEVAWRLFSENQPVLSVSVALSRAVTWFDEHGTSINKTPTLEELNAWTDEYNERAEHERVQRESVDVADECDDTMGDHLLLDGEEPVVGIPPSLHSAGWTCVRDGSPWDSGKSDDDCRSSVLANDGGSFGTITVYGNAGRWRGDIAMVKTNPDDTRLRCFDWLSSIRDFAMDGIVASFGSLHPALTGTPTILTAPDGRAAYLSWSSDAGHAIVFVKTAGGPCGTCIGCKSNVINADQSRLSWVYFIQSVDGGSIKIGRSGNPLGRLATLQTAHANTLRILAKLPGGSVVERGLHDLFAKDRIRPDGEWFRPSAAIVAFIKEIGGAA